MTKMTILAAVAALIATPAVAQPTIGVIDTGITGSYAAPVETKDFVPQGYTGGKQVTKDGRQHGDATIASVLDGAGGDAKILHANVFVNLPSGSLATSWTSAKRALDWFKANKVEYVCTNFVLQENADARSFVDYADSLGLKLVTTIGDTNNAGWSPDNDKYRPYPASDERVIATRPDNGKMLRGFQGPILRLAKYTSSPVATADANMTGKKPAEGSSFAAARVCGKLAAGQQLAALN